MERLPYIDEHSIEIGATREQVWPALASLLRADFGRTPAVASRLLGLEPARSSGDWRGTLHVGDSVRGFAVAEIDPPQSLALRGHHRFSSYELVFELETTPTGGCRVSAQTWADFPGITGRAYRAMVIGSGGHRVIVWGLLRRMARRV